MKTIAYFALDRLAHRMLAESAPFIAAGMIHPERFHGFRIEARWGLHGVLYQILDRLWTDHMHTRAMENYQRLEGSDWCDAPGWRAVYASQMAHSHPFPA